MWSNTNAVPYWCRSNLRLQKPMLGVNFHCTSWAIQQHVHETYTRREGYALWYIDARTCSGTKVRIDWWSYRSRHSVLIHSNRDPLLHWRGTSITENPLIWAENSNIVWRQIDDRHHIWGHFPHSRMLHCTSSPPFLEWCRRCNGLWVRRICTKMDVMWHMYSRQEAKCCHWTSSWIMAQALNWEAAYNLSARIFYGVASTLTTNWRYDIPASRLAKKRPW